MRLVPPPFFMENHALGRQPWPLPRFVEHLVPAVFLKHGQRALGADVRDGEVVALGVEEGQDEHLARLVHDAAVHHLDAPPFQLPTNQLTNSQLYRPTPSLPTFSGTNAGFLFCATAAASGGTRPVASAAAFRAVGRGVPPSRPIRRQTGRDALGHFAARPSASGNPIASRRANSVASAAVVCRAAPSWFVVMLHRFYPINGFLVRPYFTGATVRSSPLVWRKVRMNISRALFTMQLFTISMRRPSASSHS